MGGFQVELVVGSVVGSWVCFLVGVGGEIAKVIDKSKAGISVSPEKAKSYVAAIERYSSDTNYRLEAKNNAYKTAKSDFDYDVINENFEDLLYEVFETK